MEDTVKKAIAAGRRMYGRQAREAVARPLGDRDALVLIRRAGLLGWARYRDLDERTSHQSSGKM